MMNKTAAGNGGVGVFGALGVAFIVLKLCGVLGWPWLWVLAPFWVPPLAVVTVLAAALIGQAGNAFVKESLAKRRGTVVRGPPPAVYEPVHGWTKSQTDDYLARNPRYRAAYEAKLLRARR